MNELKKHIEAAATKPGGNKGDEVSMPGDELDIDNTGFLCNFDLVSHIVGVAIAYPMGATSFTSIDVLCNCYVQNGWAMVR